MKTPPPGTTVGKRTKKGELGFFSITTILKEKFYAYATIPITPAIIGMTNS